MGYRGTQEGRTQGPPLFLILSVQPVTLGVAQAPRPVGGSQGLADAGRERQAPVGEDGGGGGDAVAEVGIAARAVVLGQPQSQTGVGECVAVAGTGRAG